MEQLTRLKKLFRENENPEKAIWMKDYMRGKFEFYGIDTKVRRSLQKEFFSAVSKAENAVFMDTINALWELSQREFQYCAVELFRKYSKKTEVQDIEFIEKLIITKSWWDSVDGLSAWVCGDYFTLYPEQTEKVVQRWMSSENFWLQRSCLLFQLKYKERTDTDLLEGCIAQLHQEKEFFIRKAIGWILREYSKTNPEWVRDYLQKQALSPLSFKEASKYI
jgi:3-methyladenine DNA glycosylase AlkD